MNEGTKVHLFFKPQVPFPKKLHFFHLFFKKLCETKKEHYLCRKILKRSLKSCQTVIRILSTGVRILSPVIKILSRCDTNFIEAGRKYIEAGRKYIESDKKYIEGDKNAIECR
jgi:hypothetical protein